MRPRLKPLIDCFEENVTPEPNTGCLLWMGRVDRHGYGDWRIRQRHYLVHRLVWEWTNGPIPPGMCVLHHCDVPMCVLADPDPRRSHLFLGSQRDNIIDMIAKGRHWDQKLMEKDVREILIRLSHGERQSALARDFAVRNNEISMIASGKRWGHVPRCG
jgi:hypothetical protein